MGAPEPEDEPDTEAALDRTELLAVGAVIFLACVVLLVRLILTR